MKMNLDLLLNDISEHGATYFYNGEEFTKNPSKGYVVGINKNVKVFNLSKCGMELLNELKKAVNHSNFILSNLDSWNCLGLWVDTESNLLYIEETQLFSDRDEAVAVAKKFNEIAIWDCGNSKEIRFK